MAKQTDIIKTMKIPGTHIFTKARDWFTGDKRRIVGVVGGVIVLSALAIYAYQKFKDNHREKTIEGYRIIYNNIPYANRAGVGIFEIKTKKKVYGSGNLKPIDATNLYLNLKTVSDINPLISPEPQSLTPMANTPTIQSAPAIPPGSTAL